MSTLLFKLWQFSTWKRINGCFLDEGWSTLRGWCCAGSIGNWDHVDWCEMGERSAARQFQRDFLHPVTRIVVNSIISRWCLFYKGTRFIICVYKYTFNCHVSISVNYIQTSLHRPSNALQGWRIEFFTPKHLKPSSLTWALLVLELLDLDIP